MLQVDKVDENIVKKINKKNNTSRLGSKLKYSKMGYIFFVMILFSDTSFPKILSRIGARKINPKISIIPENKIIKLKVNN